MSIQLQMVHFSVVMGTRKGADTPGGGGGSRSGTRIAACEGIVTHAFIAVIGQKPDISLS